MGGVIIYRDTHYNHDGSVDAFTGWFDGDDCDITPFLCMQEYFDAGTGTVRRIDSEILAYYPDISVNEDTAPHINNVVARYDEDTKNIPKETNK